MEHETDFVGNDLDYSDGEEDKWGSNDDECGNGCGVWKGCAMRDSVMECLVLCRVTYGCNVFTYNVIDKICKLKTSDSGRTFSPGQISGRAGCYRTGSEIFSYHFVILLCKL